MTYLFVLLTVLGAAAAPRISRECNDRLHTTEFLTNAPDAAQLLVEYRDRFGHSPRAVIGPGMIRERLDRAFFRYLLRKFEIATLGLTRGTSVDANGQTYRIETATAVDFVVQLGGDGTRVVDWSALEGLGRPTAARALDLNESPEAADRGLTKLDAEVGVDIVAELIEQHLPPERRFEIHTEMDALRRYLDEIRLLFNSSTVSKWIVDARFRERLKPGYTLH